MTHNMHSMHGMAETTTTMHHMNMSGHHNITTMMDHSGMDHGSTGGMDHGNMGGMDHGSGNGGVHEMMGMNMYFTTDWNGTAILFEEWTMTETWHLAVACIFIGVLAAGYEGLKVLREILLIQYNERSRMMIPAYEVEGSKEGITVAQPSNVNTVSGRFCTWIHYLQTFLHMVQVTLSYFLMLIFMTYSVWLCLAIVLGAGLGYLIFGWKRAVVVDANEHCH